MAATAARPICPALRSTAVAVTGAGRGMAPRKNCGKDGLRSAVLQLPLELAAWHALALGGSDPLG